MPTNETPDNPQEGSPFAIGLLLRQAHTGSRRRSTRRSRSFGIERRHLMVLMLLQASGR